jgi:hypothetical protein
MDFGGLYCDKYQPNRPSRKVVDDVVATPESEQAPPIRGLDPRVGVLHIPISG